MYRGTIIVKKIIASRSIFSQLNIHHNTFMAEVLSEPLGKLMMLSQTP